MADRRLSTLIVVNPASGEQESVLATLNRTFRELDIEWDVLLTHGPEGGRDRAEEALESGCDIVGVYGGDGTIGAAAEAMRGASVPLAVLPGGTANVVAQELGIEQDLEAAVRQLYGPRRRSGSIDALLCREHLSLLRVGIGADASVMEKTTRERKDRLGWLAYLLSALEEVREREPRPLEFEIDGEARTIEVVAAIAANVGQLGRGDFHFPCEVDPFDGKMDLLLVRRANPAALLEIGVTLLTPESEVPEVDDENGEAPVLHASGRRLTIRSSGWPIHRDGDPAGETPVEIELLPAAVPIVLPPTALDPESS